MKKSLVILLAGAFLLLSSCATNGDIDNLQHQIDGLKSGQIATIGNQINSINGSITSLQETDREIKGYITALQNTASELQKSINSADGKIDDLEKALAIVNTAIENLKAKDSALEQRISDLKDYVDTQLRGAKDWVSATFATLEQYNGIVSEIGGIKGSISSINTAMEQMESRLNGKITLMKGEIEEAYTKAMGTLESSLKNWVNEQLEGYWTIAETEGKLETLEGNLAKEDESIRGDIGKLRASLDSARTELTEGYKAAIKSAIETNNGVLYVKLSEAVSGLNTRIDGEVSTINERIGKLEKRVLDLESAVSELLSRIQSLAYIPRYTDGASTMWLKITPNGNIESRDTLEFRVSPADCADSLVKVWDKAISAEAVSLLTRGAQETVSLQVVSVTGGNGKLSVVLDGSALGEKFYSGEQQMKAIVITSDGNNERTSEYVSMVAKDEPIIPNNIILYTSSDGEIVEPYNADAFGATVTSNKYKHWRGIIVFDGDITSIGDQAFYDTERLTSVRIPNSVSSIGNQAFYRCSELSSINLPESVIRIGDSAFYCCYNYTDISIPKSVTSIGNAAFFLCHCSSISVARGNPSFDSRGNCNAIVETASNRLITGCRNTVIPYTVTSIADSAFFGCDSLSFLSIPNSVTSIGTMAFSYCFDLVSIHISNSVTSIGDGAFSGCAVLQSVIIPESITRIEARVFAACPKLTSIEIPNSVTSIGERAFSGCTGLTSILIPRSVRNIGTYAFYACSGLTSIVISKDIKQIGVAAFMNCSGLQSITISATSHPAIGRRTFDGTNNCPIYVPAESVSLYKTGWIWTSYADRIYAILPEAIDLGISVKWASFNLGAITPEESGDYFAWGETNTKSDYSWSTYKWCNGTNYTLTKYNDNSSYGIVDNRTLLDIDDDVAHVKLGGEWRMPTIYEWKELLDQCNHTRIIQNEAYGWLFTSKKNGNSIFIPVLQNHVLIDENLRYDIYWSSISSSYFAYRMVFNYEGSSIGSGLSARFAGGLIRPVLAE